MQSTEYGLKLGQAIRAIRKMHDETAQLLRDLDREMVRLEFKVALGSELTRSNSKGMVDMLCQAYTGRGEWDGQLLEVTVVFDDGHEVPEPLILASLVSYRDASAKSPALLAKRWDGLSNTPHWSELVEGLGAVGTYEGEDSGNVERCLYLGQPLMSIGKVEDVLAMVDRVREAARRPRNLP